MPRNPVAAALGIHVRHGRGEKNFGLAFQDVERRGTVLALAADNLAFAELPPHHGILVQLEKRSRDLLEIRKVLQFFDVHGLAWQHRLHHALVGQRAGGARHHAFAARDAGGIAHRQVAVECDARREALAAPPQNIVMANLVAAANAAVAENAGLVIHGDHQRRIVLAARRNPARETRLRDAFQTRQSFQLAIVRLALAGAGAGMIRHQHFHQRPARALHTVGIGVHHHVVFGGTHAGGGQHAGLLHIHHANAAHPHGRFVLLMAQRGNSDAVQARGVEHAWFPREPIPASRQW